jgi:hypothetical protein
MSGVIALGGAAVISLLVIWIVEPMFKREAPFGIPVDYVIGLLAGIGFAALDYYVLVDLVIGAGVKEWMRLGAALMEGPGAAWLALWIVRQITRPPFKTNAA